MVKSSSVKFTMDKLCFEVNELTYVLIHTICYIRLAMAKPVGKDGESLNMNGLF